MRHVFHIRPIRYLLFRNWWGFRKGATWSNEVIVKAYLLDMGCLTVGLATRVRLLDTLSTEKEERDDRTK